MTNFEWLKTLDIDEMVNLVDRYCRLCVGDTCDEYCLKHTCAEGIAEWLKQKHTGG